MERPASERLCTVRIGVGAAQGGRRERPSRARRVCVRAQGERACARARVRRACTTCPAPMAVPALRPWAGKLVVIFYYKPLQAPGTWAFFGDMLARRGLVAITACSWACSGTTSPSELVVALQAIATRHGLVTRLVVQQVWCKGRSGVRGRFATERRTVKLRYLASSCEMVSTKNSVSGSRLGTFRFSRSTVSCQTNHVL